MTPIENCDVFVGKKSHTLNSAAICCRQLIKKKEIPVKKVSLNQYALFYEVNISAVLMVVGLLLVLKKLKKKA